MKTLVKKNRLLWNGNANMTLYSSKRTRNRPKSEHISFYRLNIWVSVKFISTYFSRDWVIKSLRGDMTWRAAPLQMILVSSERDQEVSLSLCTLIYFLFFFHMKEQFSFPIVRHVTWCHFANRPDHYCISTLSIPWPSVSVYRALQNKFPS